MRRYFIYLKYDGSAYHGWQIQPNGNSVQEELQRALSTLLRKDISITGAGRTDTGVHARLMTAHFDSLIVVDCQQLKYRLNRILPHDIAIDDIKEVDNDLHARFSATSRTYHYYIHQKKNPFKRNYSYEIHYKLDFDKMNEAAEMLLQTSDFGAFCKAGSDVKTTICNVTEAYWQQVDNEEQSYCFIISANRFLRNMVRAVVGTLIDVGRGRITIEDFSKIIQGKKRSEAGESVPGNALFLWDIQY